MKLNYTISKAKSQVSTKIRPDNRAFKGAPAVVSLWTSSVRGIIVGITFFATFAAFLLIGVIPRSSFAAETDNSSTDQNINAQEPLPTTEQTSDDSNASANDVSAQASNSLGVETSLVGAPPGVEHLKSYSLPVGFNDKDPGQAPYLVRTFGSLDINNIDSLFSIEAIGSVIPFMGPLQDATFGIVTPQGVKCETTTGNCPSAVRSLLPYSPYLDALPPNANQLTPRAGWDRKNQDLLTYLAKVYLDSTDDNDNRLGQTSTNYKPLFIGCIQEKGVTGIKGVKFPIYGEYLKDDAAEASVENGEGSALNALNASDNTSTRMIVGNPNPDTDSMKRFVKDTRVPPIPAPEYLKVEPADCHDCKSWAGDLCDIPESKLKTIPNEETVAAGINKMKAETNAEFSSFWDLLGFLFGRDYELFFYAWMSTPYRNEADTEKGDGRFARSIAYTPGINKITDKMDDVYNVNKTAVVLTTASGIKVIGSNLRFPQKLYTKLASDVATKCTMQQSFHPKCDPDVPGWTGCWDYMGAVNPGANDKMNPINLPTGMAKPPGKLAEFCAGVDNGVENLDPNVPGAIDNPNEPPDNNPGNGNPSGPIPTIPEEDDGNNGGNGGTPGLTGIPANAQACLAGVKVKDKTQTWNNTNGLLDTLAIAGYYAGVKNAGTGNKFKHAYCPAAYLAGLITWEGPAYIGMSRSQILAATRADASRECSKNKYSAAGPFQFTDTAWKYYSEAINWAKEAGYNIGNRPDNYVPNRCNLLDAAVAACAMSYDSFRVFANAKTSCEAYKEATPTSVAWTKNNIYQASCHFYGQTGDSVCANVDVDGDGKVEGNKCYSARPAFYVKNYTCGPGSIPTTPPPLPDT